MLQLVDTAYDQVIVYVDLLDEDDINVIVPECIPGGCTSPIDGKYPSWEDAWNEQDCYLNEFHEAMGYNNEIK